MEASHAVLEGAENLISSDPAQDIFLANRTSSLVASLDRCLVHEGKLRAHQSSIVCYPHDSKEDLKPDRDMQSGIHKQWDGHHGGF